ncbi:MULTISPECIES: HAMP domain-containing sensor histidine kinase [unclassified Enterococcus]|uniref:HAMP domain-containing sensor histidine kinase n=1 Tax=unclassified Enterococcus TaxID=2608891 RepID=UPI002474D062|nr:MULTISPECIES: HAMP domain-containing sensor histidine kinase [unclassified Enterococcus]
MKKKIYSQLWIYFACMIFGLLLMAAILFAVATFILFHFQYITHQNSPIRLTYVFAIFSVVSGTGVAIFVGRKILLPISRLSSEMRKVAEGDFSIQIDEDEKVAEVQQLLHDFNSMVKELNNIETLRDDFVSSVSHEFKTPIATIRGYVQLLQNSQLSESERQEYLTRIMDGTHQLSRLIENILKLTKVETQGMTLEEKEFRLDEQIRNVILFLEPEWEARNLEWEIDLEKSYFYGNEEVLYQVWLNIISNAIKYNQDDGKIEVFLTENEENVEILVKDSGIGMNKETIVRIFDKFYQGDTARKTKGNGLGLALAKQVVDIYQGEIDVESQENQGTTMKITLPKKNH